jgi:hypothetical protein
VLRAGFYDTLRGLPRRFGADVLLGLNSVSNGEFFLGLPGPRFRVVATTSTVDLAGGNSNTLFRTRVNLGVVAIGSTNASTVQGSGIISSASGSVAGAAISGCGCSMDAGIDTDVEGLHESQSCFKVDIKSRIISVAKPTGRAMIAV